MMKRALIALLTLVLCLNLCAQTGPRCRWRNLWQLPACR